MAGGHAREGFERGAVKVGAVFPLPIVYRQNAGRDLKLPFLPIFPSICVSLGWESGFRVGQPRWTTAFPASTTKLARVVDFPPGFMTSSTTTKSLVHCLGVTVQRT